MVKKNVLVTGGAGYIGSHTVLELLKNKYNVVVLDEVKDKKFNGRLGALKTVEKITGIKLGSRRFNFYNGDISGNKFTLLSGSKKFTIQELLLQNDIDCCIDFAAFIEAGTSMAKPEVYFVNNSVNFAKMVPLLYKKGVETIVKSSTAAVYGDINPGKTGFREDAVLMRRDKSRLDVAITKEGLRKGEELHQYLMSLVKKAFCNDKEFIRYILEEVSQTRLRQAVNVYGWTKVLNELTLEYFSDKLNKKYCILRYFNAWGVHKSGKLLEDHKPETHLIPRAMDSIIHLENAPGRKGRLKKGEFLLLFGTDFPTQDGTCIRDYIHIEDLAKAHVLALDSEGTYNLALGNGFSNREILKCVVKGAGAKLSMLRKEEEGRVYRLIYKGKSLEEIEFLDETSFEKRALYVLEWRKRKGDPPKLIANAHVTEAALNWKAYISPNNKEAMENVYKSRKNNQRGYEIYDFLIVGAGITGLTIADKLATDGNKVLVIDKRDHIGGNCYDYTDENGIIIQKYGPHIFHTKEKMVFDYLKQYAKFNSYKHKVISYYRGKFYPIPINRDTVNLFYNINLKSEKEMKRFLDTKKVNISVIKNSRDVVVSKFGEELFEAFVKQYTKKQWDLYPQELDKSVLERLPIRYDTNPYYFDTDMEGMPLGGYIAIFEKMIMNDNITVMLNTDFFEIKDKVKFRKLIFTGKIDEFFKYKFGKLDYRCINFVFETLDIEGFQPNSVVNYTDNDVAFTRITEYKKFYFKKCRKTVICKEFTNWDAEPCYAVPNKKNKELYNRYSEKAKKLKDVYFAGRLGTYRYLNIDTAVLEGLKLYRMLKGINYV